MVGHVGASTATVASKGAEIKETAAPDNFKSKLDSQKNHYEKQASEMKAKIFLDGEGLLFALHCVSGAVLGRLETGDPQSTAAQALVRFDELLGRRLALRATGSQNNLVVRRRSST